MSEKLVNIAADVKQLYDELDMSDASDTLLVLSGRAANDLEQLIRFLTEKQKQLKAKCSGCEVACQGDCYASRQGQLLLIKDILGETAVHFISNQPGESK